jgi:hypothetical protein
MSSSSDDSERPGWLHLAALVGGLLLVLIGSMGCAPAAAALSPVQAEASGELSESAPVAAVEGRQLDRSKPHLRARWRRSSRNLCMPEALEISKPGFCPRRQSEHRKPGAGCGVLPSRRAPPNC